MCIFPLPQPMWLQTLPSTQTKLVAFTLVACLFETRVDLTLVKCHCSVQKSFFFFFYDSPHIYVKALLLTAHNTFSVFVFARHFPDNGCNQRYNDRDLQRSFQEYIREHNNRGISLTLTFFRVRRSDYSHEFACGPSFT